MHSLNVNGNLQDLDSEKQSLKTALKILYADLETAEGNMQPPNDKSKAQQHPWVEAHGKTKSDPINPELNNSNKYSALHIEDDGEVNNNEIQVIENSSGRKSKHSSHHIPKAKSPSKPQDPGPHKHSNKNNGIDNPASAQQRKIAILGDSMIKHLNPKRLLSQKKCPLSYFVVLHRYL